MAFILIHVRPSGVEEPRDPWLILSSESRWSQPARDYADARVYLTNTSRNSALPYFAVFFGEDNLPLEAFKIDGGRWRNLNLKVAEKLPDDPSTLHLYPGVSRSCSPDLVRHW